MPNTFNKNFSNVVSEVQFSINLLSLLNINSFYHNPTDEIGFKNIIMSLKGIGPKKIPTKVLETTT